MLVLIVALMTGTPYHAPPQPQADYWVEYQAHLDGMTDMSNALGDALSQ